MNEQPPIFYDPKGTRRRWYRRATAVLLTVAAVLLAVFIISVSVFRPLLPNVSLKTTSAPVDEANRGTPVWANEAYHEEERKKQRLEKPRFVSERSNASAIKTSFVQPQNNAKPTTIGFYVNWDDSSLSSLKRNIQKIDWLVPEWIRLKEKPDADGDMLVKDYDQRALDFIQKEKPELVILPLVQNYVNEEWNAEVLANAIKDEPTREQFINQLAQTIEENHFGGVTIDLEDVPKTSQKNLMAFMKRLHEVFKAKNLIVAQAVPFNNDDWNYAEYAKVNDFLMLMAYDEHWATSAPGAIAGQDWFESVLEKRMRELDPAKTVVCIGNYGYNWATNQKEATEVSFQEIVLAARDSEEKIKFDSNARNPYFAYSEDDGSRHTIWFLDAATAYNEIKFSQQFHPFGYALWRLGSEDPSLWSVFGNDKIAAPNVEDLKTLRYGYDVDFEGTGEILNVVAQPQDGSREIETDKNDFLESEIYTAIPSSYVIERTGDRRGLVALTFDDGPDPVWTPKILDILKQENVKAAFFIVGQNGQTYPDLVKRIVAEGHDIGNHSFTHPNMGEMPAAVDAFEMNATQRLIQSLTGRGTILMRPPYFGDAEPKTADEVEPIVLAKQLGYLTIGLHVDPDDWARPGADVITQKTIEGVTNQSLDADLRGNIVLLHDAGGDRSQTVAALPEIIHQLKAKGHRFVTVSELAGLSQEQTMPFVRQADPIIQTNGWSFYALANLQWLLGALFLTGVILGVGRLATVGALATVAYFRSKKFQNPKCETENPLVSVIVPAYNEEKIIVKTIKSLLASDYKNFEIIVVDDGSLDKTGEVVAANFATEPRVRLYRKENAGKGEALNYGFLHSTGEIVIGLDADTIFERKTISELVAKFADKKVGAVAGNAKVGNRVNTVTRWQALEYVTSQNLDRRALAWLNAITVVPGAVGAWRREAILEAGGFLSNTLAEDQDLTIKVRMNGWRIDFAERAVAWTEAPDTLRGLAKQRFRWSFGTLQCLWKHRRALFNPKYGALGFVAMPQVWTFQIFFQVVSPLMDAMMIWTFVAHVIERLEHPHEFDPTKLENVAFYYLLFLAVDTAAAALAFVFEPKEDKSLLLWIPFQRFGYRQVMYWVMVKSVTTAVKGAIVGWNKLERKNTVREVEG
jgi:cellulose synthase/poly-beta-1,6-N-acetylglucosamine synthase-like glycosyltransferase/peptidoglycan/xylan/chitin deacetylase (PgdA/CDA1 family)/spore germination protein YaaH